MIRRHPFRRPVGAIVFATLLFPAVTAAQERLRPFTDGDGRIHGAPVLEVTEQDLHPGQVQTLNLTPGFHTILEFPYTIVRVDAGDPDIFLAAIVGNKLSLKATRLSLAETSMTVILGDADLTVIPFMVRADSTQAPLYVVRYTDPVAAHLNEAERRIAARVTSANDSRLDDLAEARLKQRLLWAGDVAEINKRASAGRAGERVALEVVSAQQILGDDGQPELTIRYSVFNQTVAPMEDLRFTVRVITHTRRFLVLSRRSARELYDVQDLRSAHPVPAGTVARGLLVLPMPDLARNQSVELEATAFNGQRHLTVERILVGR